MSRACLYIFCGIGLVPYRKAYGKARYRKKMGRYINYEGFKKKGERRKTNGTTTRAEH